MKFSYTLLKKLVPAIKSKADLVLQLNTYAFEAEMKEGNTLEVAISANRFSSAASHWGLATEIGAMYKTKFLIPNSLFLIRKTKESGIGNRESGRRVNLEIFVKSVLCRRFMTQYFENIKIKPSPKWMQKILLDCGFRSINNIVDITNYVMLETGQPLHAFDYSKVSGGKLIIRPADISENLVTLDEQKFNLDKNILVIADERDPLDVAGIKGGKKAEINEKTDKIILTAANFDGPTIYKASKKLGLTTDASVRNSHDLSPVLVEMAMTRAAELIGQLADGVSDKRQDFYPKKVFKKVLKFNIDKFNQLSGLRLKEKEALGYLEKLGFEIRSGKVVVPATRDDIERFEDLAEEVLRLYGLNKLPAIPPHIVLSPSGYEDAVSFKEKIRKVLISFGLSEVYNYSFIGKKDLDNSAGEFFGLKAVALVNPLSADFEYLRASLAPRLLKNIEDNFRFFNEVKIFEIGHVFGNNPLMSEKNILGMTIASKKEISILELKGLVDELLERLGLVERHYPDLNFELPFLNQRESLRIESDHQVLGYIGSIKGSKGYQAIAEIDLEKIIKLAQGEREYQSLAKYPSIMRDISLLVSKNIRVNQIMEIIENSAPHLLDDVDLIDFYENDDELGEGFKSITFRLVFLAEDRTLTDKEVDEELQKITGSLINSLGVEVR